jgi:hypothetical protein
MSQDTIQKGEKWRTVVNTYVGTVQDSKDGIEAKIGGTCSIERMQKNWY